MVECVLGDRFLSGIEMGRLTLTEREYRYSALTGKQAPRPARGRASVTRLGQAPSWRSGANSALAVCNCSPAWRRAEVSASTRSSAFSTLFTVSLNPGMTEAAHIFVQSQFRQVRQFEQIGRPKLEARQYMRTDYADGVGLDLLIAAVGGQPIEAQVAIFRVKDEVLLHSG